MQVLANPSTLRTAQLSHGVTSGAVVASFWARELWLLRMRGWGGVGPRGGRHVELVALLPTLMLQLTGGVTVGRWEPLRVTALLVIGRTEGRTRRGREQRWWAPCVRACVLSVCACVYMCTRVVSGITYSICVYV